jgi:hypothetical protein
MRGLDQHDADYGGTTLAASGVVYVDGNGHNKLGGRARAFQRLGFATAILRDCDRPDVPQEEEAFVLAGGRVFKWATARATEDELFAELPDEAVLLLIEAAVNRIGAPTVNDQIKTASRNSLDLARCRSEVTPAVRSALGVASRSDKAPWFKSIGDMEYVARTCIGPALPLAGASLRATLEAIRSWARGAVG